MVAARLGAATKSPTAWLALDLELVPVGLRAAAATFSDGTQALRLGSPLLGIWTNHQFGSLERGIMTVNPKSGDSQCRIYADSNDNSMNKYQVEFGISNELVFKNVELKLVCFYELRRYM